MSDLFGNHIVGFPTRRLIFSTGLSHEENLRKMRLLTFMQMAENRKDIDYDSIQKEMDITEDEVEDFIIDGTV